jgi:hypothetical protein
MVVVLTTTVALELPFVVFVPLLADGTLVTFTANNVLQ